MPRTRSGRLAPTAIDSGREFLTRDAPDRPATPNQDQDPRGMPRDEMLPPKYPDPRVPKNPVLGWSSFRGALSTDDAARYPSVLSLPHRKFVTSARVAIAIALQRLGVGAGDRVLVPAYHCLSMVEPIVFCDATPVFFALSPRLDATVATLESLDVTGVKAMLVTHYFGFPQAMGAITAFASARGIPIIEDCAHAVFGLADGRPIGSWGEYAAISLMKFFPVYDGGCLVSATRDLSGLVLQAPSLRFEMKAVFNSFERGLHYQRFPGIQAAARTALRVKDGVWDRVKRARSRGDGAFTYHDPAASEGVNGLDPSWLDRRMSIASQQLIDHLPTGRIVSRRRVHYRRFLDAWSDLPDARPLHPTLPESVVPYVFPLHVERPERVFRRLKEEAVPIFRWERLWDEHAVRADPLSARYATEIFQFPCHQELTDDDVSWMIERVRAAFRAT